MTLDDYQRLAARTACYDEDVWHTYLIPALIGEVGEVIQVFAKHVRDCDPGGTSGAVLCPDCQPKLLDECGDGLWMTSQILRHIGAIGVTWDRFDAEAYELNVALERLTYYCDAAAGEWFRTQPCISIRIPLGVMESISTITHACGSTIEEVAEANIEKLADRAARGVIQGDGER